MKNVKDQISFLVAVIAFALAIITSGFGFIGDSTSKGKSKLKTKTSEKEAFIVKGFSPEALTGTFSGKLLTVFEILPREAQTMKGSETTPLRIRATNVTEKILSFNYTLVIRVDSVAQVEEGVMYLMPFEVVNLETLNGYSGLVTDYHYDLKLSQVEIFEGIISDVPVEPDLI